MNTIPPAWLLLVPVAVVLTGLACRWWYERRLRRLEQRTAKLHADREALQEQVRHARRELGQVQKQLSTWRQAVARAAPRKPGVASAEANVPPPRASIKLQPEIPSGLVFEAPPLAANGFADTQPFESAGAPA